MSAPKTSEIYEEAVELRELLNKIPDWKERMSAQFMVCIHIGNRRMSGDVNNIREQESLRLAIGSSLSNEQRLRVVALMYSLHNVGRYEFPSTPERYAVRAFIMSVILGQEYANADAVTLINGLREGVSTE